LILLFIIIPMILLTLLLLPYVLPTYLRYHTPVKIIRIIIHQGEGKYTYISLSASNTPPMIPSPADWISAAIMVKPSEMFLQEQKEGSSSEEAKTMMRLRSSGQRGKDSLLLSAQGSAKRSKTEKSGEAVDPSFLPIGFQPGPHSVVIGRNRDSKNAEGSKRLKAIAARYLEDYSDAAQSKPEKSLIVTRIYNMIKKSCPAGGFVKYSQEHGRWIKASPSSAREKIGYVFRDLLSDRYRSSSKSKMVRRRQRMEEESKGSNSSIVTGTNDRDLDGKKELSAAAATAPRETSNQSQQQPPTMIFPRGPFDPDPIHSTSSSSSHRDPDVPQFIGYHHDRAAVRQPSSRDDHHIQPDPLEVASHPAQNFPHYYSAGDSFLPSPIQRARGNQQHGAQGPSHGSLDRNNNHEVSATAQHLGDDFSVADDSFDGDISKVFD
jgi:hypothetical protein